jgi:hypothetical protein
MTARVATFLDPTGWIPTHGRNLAERAAAFIRSYRTTEKSATETLLAGIRRRRLSSVGR